MKILPHKLRGLRESLKKEDSKWTQQFIAEQIDIARVTYTAYENGTKTPPIDILLKLASLFEVSTDYLLGRTNHRQTLEEITAPIKNEQDLLKWFVNLPDQSIESLKKLHLIWKIIKDEPEL